MALIPFECIDDCRNEGSIHSLSNLLLISYKENVEMYREMQNSE